MIKYSKKSIPLFVFIFSCFLVGQVLACAPSEVVYISDNPNVNNPFLVVDKNAFMEGEYGIIADWGLPYLYHVYRTLNGQKLEESEVGVFTSFYEDIFRFSYLYYWNEQTNNGIREAVNEWRDARELISQEYVPISVYKQVEDKWSTYLNCYTSAFKKATETLKSRIDVYSETEMQEWLKGQDAVFENCGDGSDDFGFMGFNLDKDLQASANTQEGENGLVNRISDFIWNILVEIGNFFKSIFIANKEVAEEVDNKVQPKTQLVYDQDYQQATASFYKGDLQVAEQQFKAIAIEVGHPWQSYAALALGRTYIRMTTLNDENEKLKNAQAQFQVILSDVSMAEVHKGSRLLLNYVNFKLDPDQLVESIESTLFSENIDTDEIIQNLKDLTLTHYYDLDEVKDLDADFFQWVFIWQRGYYKEEADFALLKYQESQSLPWLLASLKAISHQEADFDNDLVKGVMVQAEQTQEDSPAFLTIQYYLLKILASDPDQGDYIRNRSDDLLKSIDKQKFLAVDAYFNGLKLLTAENFMEVLLFSLNKAIISDNLTHNFLTKLSVDKQTLILSQESQDALESFVTLREWVEIIKKEDFFSVPIKQFLRVSVFVRAVLLERWDVAQEVAQIISLDNIDMANDIMPFLNASTLDKKRFTADFFILKYPLASYNLAKLDDVSLGDQALTERDRFRDNWWPCCSKTNSQDESSLFRKFFSDVDLEQAKVENEQLCPIIAPNYLAESVINYANNNLSDQMVPEALHLVINATNYSWCANEETSGLSKQAFQILHNNYPSNPWTQKTPYWY